MSNIAHVQIYTSEVGFDGTPQAFLAYSSLETVQAPNSPRGFEANQRDIISFSLYPQALEGIILILQNEVFNSILVLENRTGP